MVKRQDNNDVMKIIKEKAIKYAKENDDLVYKTLTETPEIIGEPMYLICTKCQKKIAGTTTSQLLYNLRIHMEAKHG